MKIITGLLALALAVAAGAAENFITDTEAVKGLFYPRNQEFSKLDNATRHAELERIAPIVKEQGNFTCKRTYAFLVTALYVNETDSVTLAQAEAKFDEAFASVNPPAELDEHQQDVLLNDKLCSINRAYVGEASQDKLLALEKEAYAKYNGKTGKWSSLQFFWIVWEVTGDISELKKSMAGNDLPQIRNAYVKITAGKKDYAECAPVFLELLSKGELDTSCAPLFPEVLAYELESQDFDAAALKSKLNKAILIYKSKARQWKPTKEGESNPFIEFVGMLQDTAKDL